MSEPSPPPQAVTVLGLGPMGAALAQALLDAGHPTTVWNRTAGKAADLVTAGADHAEQIATAVVASPTVVICVISDDVVRTVLEPVVAGLRGRTVVNLTADTPDRARSTAAWAQDHGIRYVDGSIMTPASTIGRPEAAVLYSGDAEAYEEVRGALTAFGGKATFLGSDPGRAAAYDVALLDIFWTGMSGVVHALALARTEGVAAAELAPFTRSMAALIGEVAGELAPEVDDGRFPGEGSTLRSNAEGMRHVIEAATSRGIDASVLEAAHRIAERAIHAGHGGDGFGRLVDVLSNTTEAGR